MEKDISKARILSLDVFNANPEPVQIAAAFLTGDKWTYYETGLIKAEQGWNKGIAVDLGASGFKSEASGWEYTTTLQDREKLHQIVLLLYNGKKMMTLLFDNIRFE